MGSSCPDKYEDFLLPGMVRLQCCAMSSVCKTPGCGKSIGGHPPRPTSKLTGNIPPHIYLNIPLLFNETNTMAYIIYLFSDPAPGMCIICVISLYCD
jgi:hypothetical protein